MSTQGIKVVMNDLFAVGENSVLFHACNTIGSWGAGIAVAFKDYYPNAFEVYRQHCEASTPSKLIGTLLLIPPQAGDLPRKHYIACLFTSKYYGKRKGTPEEILGATEESFADLVEEYMELRSQGKVPEGGLVGCKINSARFAVPWDDTAAVMKEVMKKKGFEEEITIYTIEEGEQRNQGDEGSSNRGGRGGRGSRGGRGGRGDGTGRGWSRGSRGSSASGADDMPDDEETTQETASDISHDGEATEEVADVTITPISTSLVPSKRPRSLNSSSTRRSQSSLFSRSPSPPSPQRPRSPERSPSPVDYNNLPYKAPVVVPLLKSPSEYGCMVRDGPIGTPEGAEERFVLIAKKSFRGACAWRDNDSTDDNENDDFGEVELLWTVDEEEFILMRNPLSEHEKEKGLLASKQTHWVNKKYF